MTICLQCHGVTDIEGWELVPGLALAVARLNDELLGEDVGQLGTVPVAATCHLQCIQLASMQLIEGP